MFIPWWLLIVIGILVAWLFSEVRSLREDFREDATILQNQISNIRIEVEKLTQEREKQRRDPHGNLIDEDEP